MLQLKIVAVQRWRRMSPIARKRWIEQAVDETLNGIEAAGRELDNFERFQISGALSGSFSGLYDFGKCCIGLVSTPKDQINMESFNANDDLQGLNITQFRRLLLEIKSCPALDRPIFN